MIRGDLKSVVAIGVVKTQIFGLRLYRRAGARGLEGYEARRGGGFGGGWGCDR